MRHLKKIKMLGLTALVCVTSSALVGQSVGLQINTPNFADSAGSVIPDNTPWGIIFDVDGSGFAGSSGGQNLGLVNTNAPMAESARPDVFVESEIFGNTNLALVWTHRSTTIPFGPNAGSGALGSGLEIRHASGIGLVPTGAQFGVIWFPGLAMDETPQPGDSYGFYTNTNLTMPSAGDTINYSPFIDNATIKTADYTVVPEPSTYAAIFGFGALLFVFLRRRFKK